MGETGPESEQACATSAHTRVQRDRTRGASYHSGPYDKKRPGTNGPRANLISLEFETYEERATGLEPAGSGARPASQQQRGCSATHLQHEELFFNSSSTTDVAPSRFARQRQTHALSLRRSSIVTLFLSPETPIAVSGRANESIIRCQTSRRRAAGKKDHSTLLECYHAPDEATLLAVMSEPVKRREPAHREPNRQPERGHLRLVG